MLLPPTQIQLVFKLVMEIRRVQQKAAWFENYFCVSSDLYISTVLTMDLFCSRNFANVTAHSDRHHYKHHSPLSSSYLSAAVWRYSRIIWAKSLCTHVHWHITDDVGLIYSLCFPEMSHCQFCSSHIVIVPAGIVMLFSPAVDGAVFGMLESLHSS